MLATLPTTNFSANDFIVAFSNCYDKYQNVAFVQLSSTTGTLAYTGTAAATGVVTNTVIRLSRLSGGAIVEFAVKATATPTVDNGTIAVTVNVGGTTMPASQQVSWYKVSGAVATNQTLFLSNDATALEVTIRPKSNGTSSVAFGEQIRGLLLPFNRENPSLTNIVSFFYNSAEYELNVFRGNKYLDAETAFATDESPLTPTGQVYAGFSEQLTATLRRFFIDSPNQLDVFDIGDFNLGINAAESNGNNTAFYLYEQAVCNRTAIYLSGRYAESNLIDVSTVVLAFIDGYGLTQYARFNGNNIARFNVEAGTLKKDVTSTVSPANNGEIYEGIELTLESDSSGSQYAYIVTADEVQRVIGGLMAAPFIWLVAVVGGSEYFIPVRIERSSVKFIGSLQDSQPKASLTIILNQPLGIAQP